MKLNTPTKPLVNNEGVTAKRITPEQQLRRLVMSTLLWEGQFYVDGEEIASLIKDTLPKVDPLVASAIAIEARHGMKLRHVPLLLAVEMVKLPTHRPYVADVLATVIDRPDELTEVLAIYWKGGRAPVAAQIKKGIAAAFTKFGEYALAKYNRDGAIKLRDALFISHAKPKDAEQADLWKKLIAGTLSTPDTWEVGLSAATDKHAEWTRLLTENKMGALALLRNLRNMQQANVSRASIQRALEAMKTDRVLPFRFIAAARAVPAFEDIIEPVMLRALEGADKLHGTTTLLIDTSPSMGVKLSSKSDLSRKDAAFALAVLLREICDNVQIAAFSSTVGLVPPRRGFALADAIESAVPSNGTLLGRAIAAASGSYDRLIVVTDEESQDAVCDPDDGKLAYMINVASSKNGVGYGKWVHVDGFSESVVTYIQALEAQ